MVNKNVLFRFNLTKGRVHKDVKEWGGQETHPFF